MPNRFGPRLLSPVRTVLGGLLLAGWALVGGWASAAQPPKAPPAPPALAQPTNVSSVAGDFVHTLRTTDGRTRRYLVHTPPSYDGRRPLPVVLAFHGGGGRAETMVRQSRLNPVADKYGFVVVYPDGTGRLRLLTFNAGTCCGYAVAKKVDDVAFVSQLLDALPGRYAIDPRRVYATGMSNGAMFCYRLAAELSERIAAIAPVAGDMGVDGPQPRRSVPVMHFHGLADRNVLYEGGLGPNQYEKTPHRSIADTLAFWIRANHCQAEPVAQDRTADYLFDRWEPRPEEPGAPVVLYRLLAGGHTWPGGEDVTPWAGTGPVVAQVSASTLMWQFFQQFSLEPPPSGPSAGL